VPDVEMGAHMSRWGLTIPLPGLPLAEQREIIQGLYGLGYTAEAVQALAPHR